MPGFQRPSKDNAGRGTLSRIIPYLVVSGDGSDEKSGDPEIVVPILCYEIGEHTRVWSPYRQISTGDTFAGTAYRSEGATTVVMAVSAVAQFGIHGGVEILDIPLIAGRLFDEQKSFSVQAATGLPADTGHRLLYCNVASDCNQQRH